MRLSRGTLERYKERALPVLIQVAKERGVISYGELTRRLGGPGRAYIGEVVGEISEDELRAGRGRLSAVVVRSDTGMVSGGFFGLPKTPAELERKAGEWQNAQLTEEERSYWQDERDRLYTYWQEHDR